MDYHDPAVGTDLAERTRAFVDEVVLPAEREVVGSGESVAPETVEALRVEARERELYAPQMPERYGGLGLSFLEALPAFEAAGRSFLGPLATRVDAPDEGNMHLLELVGTEAQQERWLEPLVAGQLRSGFSMTEPMPGAGSDPKMVRTTAERDGDEWVIDGHKWWTTSGSEADLLIVLARTDPDAHPYQGASLFLVPADADGVEVVRDVPHLGGAVTGASHAEIRYDGVRVLDENLLGNQDAGFLHVQERLGPARLTHCMRFSGLAARALGIARAYATERQAFGEAVADKQAVRFAMADAETRLHAARTMVRHAAEALDAGDQARTEVAMCKVFTANAVQEAVDLAVQTCGGSGISKDLPLADMYEGVRSFRIIDGADEVHKRTIARALFEDVPAGELAGLPRYGA